MFAHLLALCCLAAAVSTARSEPASDAGLAVYLNPSVALPASAVEPMKRELTQLMQTAGYSVDWFDASTPLPNAGVPFLAVVKLDGPCAVTAGGGISPAEIGNLDRLATTAVSNGHVLPFISVDCRTLTGLLSPSLASEPTARRDYLYGRALARVVAHELYHALLDTPCHSRDGVAKAAFSARDLLSSRFAFEEDALAKLEKRAAESSADGAAAAAAENPTGRQ